MEPIGPRPGRRVRGSRTGRPIMALFDLVGRRWALRILWELHRGSPLTLRSLQARCGDISSSVLAQRVAELHDALLIAKRPDGYALTSHGASLVSTLDPVQRWSETWARALEDRMAESSARPVART